MAVFTVNANEVKPLSGQQLFWLPSAAAIGAGAAIYENGSGQAAAAQADGTQAEAEAIGITVSNSLLAGQPIQYVKTGDVQLDTASIAEAAVGDVVVLGATAGGLYPSEDLTNGDFPTILGVIKQNSSGTILTVHILPLRIERA